MKTIRYIFVVILFISQAKALGQKALNNRQDRASGISADLGGYTTLGISFSKYLSPKLEGNVGIGSIGVPFALIVSSGVDYHFMAKRSGKWSPYVGAHLSAWNPNHVDLLFACTDWYPTSKPSRDKYLYFGCNRNEDFAVGLYNPVGIRYYADQGFTFGIEFGLYSRFGQYNLTRLSGGLKLGYRFQ